MKHCPNPQCESVTEHGVIAEFRDEIERCSDCGGPLVPGAAAREEAGAPASAREIAATFEYPHEAQLFAAYLRSFDIDARLRDQFLVTADPILSRAIGGVKVDVPQEQLEAAQGLHADYLRGDADAFVDDTDFGSSEGMGEDAAPETPGSPPPLPDDPRRSRALLVLAWICLPLALSWISDCGSLFR